MAKNSWLTGWTKAVEQMDDDFEKRKFKWLKDNPPTATLSRPEFDEITAVWIRDGNVFFCTRKECEISFDPHDIKMLPKELVEYLGRDFGLKIPKEGR